ncbi:MAG TPA: hypothetical protein VN462_03915 [Negativicutes bacterium]|nr:hypothetical protein [Negativicutes bacterium]
MCRCGKRKEGGRKLGDGKREGTGRKAGGNRKVNFFITRMGEGFSRAALLAEASGKSLRDVMVLKKPDISWKDVAVSLGITKEQIKAVYQDIAAIKLRNKLSIPNETALALLRQGYHPRHIAVANILSKKTGKSINDILAMKRINNAWQDVADALGVDDKTFMQDLKELKAVVPHGIGHGFHGA